MKIEKWKLSDIKPYANNPRQNDGAVDAVAESIRQFGFRQPIVVDAEGVIIVGHTRYKAAKKLGLTEVPVVVAADLTPEQIRAYRIADNKTADLATWDLDLLPEELAALDAEGFDLSLIGFSDEELAQLLGKDITRGLTDPDEIPEPPDEPVTQPGDLWIQGQRTLSAFASKDLHQEVNAPACHATFHDVALLAGMLLDQAQCQATQPG